MWHILPHVTFKNATPRFCLLQTHTHTHAQPSTRVTGQTGRQPIFLYHARKPSLPPTKHFFVIFFFFLWSEGRTCSFPTGEAAMEGEGGENSHFWHNCRGLSLFQPQKFTQRKKLWVGRNRNRRGKVTGSWRNLRKSKGIFNDQKKKIFLRLSLNLLLLSVSMCPWFFLPTLSLLVWLGLWRHLLHLRSHRIVWFSLTQAVLPDSIT